MLEKDYQILRLARDADTEDIRKSFIKLSRRYHPEHFPEKFKQIKNSYDRLMLKWGAIKPYVQEIAALDTAQELCRFIMEEARHAKSSSKSEKLPEFDVYSLEPVLNASGCRLKIKALLEDIHNKGIDYCNPPKK